MGDYELQECGIPKEEFKIFKSRVLSTMAEEKDVPSVAGADTYSSTRRTYSSTRRDAIMEGIKREGWILIHELRKPLLSGDDSGGRQKAAPSFEGLSSSDVRRLVRSTSTTVDKRQSIGQLLFPYLAGRILWRVWNNPHPQLPTFLKEKEEKESLEDSEEKNAHEENQNLA